MTHRVRSAFGRFLALGVGFAIALVIVTSPLAAQQTTGKIEGTVSDQAGVPIANAQVFIVGTSFGAISNDKGYYFINNVPVGTYTVRGQFIGYAPAELRGVRVQGGQTATADVKMQSSAVVLTGVTVTAAANPIVPRDQVSSKSIINGDLVRDLPIDDVRNIVGIQPGVVESGANAGVSIRGGRPGEANVYIDGAPVRSTNMGSQRVTIGTNAVEEASVTTGALGVEFADAQSGVISFTTKAGGQSYAGSASYASDEPFGNAVSNGLNRFEASFGGPVPKVTNLTFFLSSVVQGQLTTGDNIGGIDGFGQDKNPTYVWGGVDTTVLVPDANKNQTQVVIPQFVQYTGECNAADNFGFECQGRRFPMNWQTTASLQGKVQYTYGQGSRVALSGLASGVQGRFWPGAAIGDPASYRGFHNWSRNLTLDANHTFIRGAERALSLNVNFSRQQDNQIIGPLDPTYEVDSRSPALGLELGTVKFAGFDNFPFPITQTIINNIRTNSGTRVPLLNREDLRNAQPYRMNPYGLVAGGWRTQGMDVGATLYQETRYSGRAFFDFQANRFNRFQFGGDIVKTDLAYWSSNILRQFGMDAYVVDPVKYGIFGMDRLDLGDVVLELGLRYDYYNSNALFANTPGRIYSNPAWSPQARTNPDSLAAAVDRVFTASIGHSTISPRLRVSFPVTENTGFRLSYSHQVQTPEFTTLLTGINNDLDFTNTNDIFGRDLQFGKSIQFEFGVRHAFSQDMVLDVSAYNKDKISDYAARILPYADPLNPGDTTNLNVLTNSDFGNVRGVDIKFDRRVGNYVNASAAYTFQLAKGTGSDPFSYLRTTSRQISQVTGSRVPPPQAILPIDDNRTHNIVGSVALTLPADWRKGTPLGTALRDVSVFAAFRVVSGQPYTRQINNGAGTLAPRQGFGLIGTTLGAVNSATMPWTKNIDLRLNKGFKIGGTDITAYADVRNLFNFKNVTAIYVETGDVVNAAFRTQILSPEFASMANEASTNNALRGGGAIDLSGCGSWKNPANCVLLSRAEARFGNGNGTYTLAEQTTALRAYFDAFNGPQFQYGPPRNIRVGVEVNF
jgi:carboxypeptidase family protein/TonB-dependent receptor-like protein